MSNDKENGEVGSGNESVYDEYGGHNVIYAQYDRATSVGEKIWKRKWWLIGLAFVLIIVSIAIGLGIHFGTKPEPATPTIPQKPSTSVMTAVVSLNSPSSSNVSADRPETVVLTLSTYLPSNVPMLIGLNGEVNDDLRFTYDPRTEVRGSCAASLDGEMFVLGGWYLPQQMSKVQDCKLSSVGQLPFDFLAGACKVFSFGILLCFAINAKQECHSFNGVSFPTEPSSTFPHEAVLNLGSYRQSPFVTGGKSLTYGLKTEIFDRSAEEWTQADDYPFANSDISHYGTAHTDESVYIIGGLSDFTTSILSNSIASQTSTIAEYKNGAWTKVGNLKQARGSHGAITVGGRTLIIGGMPNIDNADVALMDRRIDTEVWELGSFKTEIMNPTLTNYVVGGFFEVEAGFCSRN